MGGEWSTAGELKNVTRTAVGKRLTDAGIAFTSEV
jgi:hypothetical protein